MESFFKISTIEAKAYGIMKDKLKMQSDEDFLKYMRVKTINQFNQKNLIIGVSPTVDINTNTNQANAANIPNSGAKPGDMKAGDKKAGDKKAGDKKPADKKPADKKPDDKKKGKLNQEGEGEPDDHDGF